MNRRQLLMGAAAAAIAPSLPRLPAAAMPASPVPSPRLAFIVGTDGEFDWIKVWARSAEEAIQAWYVERGIEPDEDCFAPECERVPAWDSKNAGSLKPADWINAGLGHTCARCHGEAGPWDGARAIGDDAICSYCLTIADLVALGDDEAVAEQLADRICDQGEEVTRNWAEAKGIWDDVAGAIWPKALVLASEGTS